MFGELTEEQIDQVLYQQLFGRMAMISSGKPYVVPVSYAFDGEYLYFHSRGGRKIEAMRRSPHVCFLVDSIDHLDSWRSVIVNGTFEELTTAKAKDRAMKLLSDKLDPLLVTNIVRQPKAIEPGVVEKKLNAIYYRILIKEKTGRFQKLLPAS